MWRSLVMGIGIAFAASAYAQQAPPDPSADPITGSSPTSQSPFQRAAPASRSPMYRDLDLLRRHDFAEAEQAIVSLRVTDQGGLTPANLTAQDFTLFVNGTRRNARLHAPGSSVTTVEPLVLLVFPPNQPIVHWIGVREATKYFSAQPAEVLPWRVGIFDSNGKLTPFTNGRTQLLANLDLVLHTTEPFQYTTDIGAPLHFRSDGDWLTKAENAIAVMQRFEGPKVILAMNPLTERIYGLNDQILANDGPETLTDIARHLGAHIYVANVGGPEVLIPGGEAADAHPAQINRGAQAPLLGTVPSANNQVDPRQIAALNNFAYRASQMMQTAQATLGGFSNSLSDLAAQIHHDLDGNYSLEFDLSPEDLDRGIPSVEVRLGRSDIRVAILDVAPLSSSRELNRASVSKKLMEALANTAKHPVSSPDFRITQHVDYFPLHAGLEPVLPMSCIVEWTGAAQSPQQLSIVESVEDANLSTVILEREISARWDGRSLSWERDGQLSPGRYVWRVAVHDGTGKVFASSEEKIAVGFPHRTAVAVSSLVLGKTCRDDGQSGSTLLRRPLDETSNKDRILKIDPMHIAGCRLKPDSTDRFVATDMLHAFVRIYPAGKLTKHEPESWTAKFVLRSQSGSVQIERDMPFSIDAGSGYLASIEMPLNAPDVVPGPYTLDVEMHGPGIRSDLKQSRAISIAAATN